ncbi:response regulator [Actinoplanes derwentensis]|uniref:DNA-binding response regulator, NarL/FixJ family, contains REC and HTH domains n=1 Tax=Actinoplanes derwentensis TaxID=113562 RepID=A0A1H1U698_9ACTN|nr:response regulator transcription factor [Actinoplanes derwentensis]GID85212.1 DNA-binding response regulator [Actinoplanes derwentensis]SDS68040.1 DNA-binding response regulator, NarL/FixJ family, contains REC and HTH domains [Actinoplanes derwentensis]
MITVVLADDHAMFRSGVRAILDTQDDIACVAEAADGEQAVEQVLRLRPDVAILDVRMPRRDGLGAARAILAVPGNRTRVIVLTTHDSDDYVREAVTAGAHGFLLKSMPAEELIAAVRIAARGDVLIDPSIVRRHLARIADALSPAEPPGDIARLTAREREVLQLLSGALSNTEIARALHVGEETVKTHVSSILRKLELRDRTHAVAYAHLTGFATRPGHG